MLPLGLIYRFGLPDLKYPEKHFAKLEFTGKPTDLQLQFPRSGNRIIFKMYFDDFVRNVNNVLYEEFQVFQEGQKKRKI